VINDQIAEMGKFHLFVGIFWNRLGTPTPRAESGTVEEVERATAALEKHGRPDIWLYFSKAPASLNTDEEIDQRRKVIAFKSSTRPSYTRGFRQRGALSRHLPQ